MSASTPPPPSPPPAPALAPSSPPSHARLLIAEDEDAIRTGLAAYLRERGFEVCEARDGAEALERALAGPPFDLLVLDVAMPRHDGFEVLRRLRERGARTPVIFLTARGHEVDRVVGLELGADDYVVKPFFLRELEARVKAVLRRAAAAAAAPSSPLARRAQHPGETPTELRFGDVRVDLEARCAWKRGRLVELAPKEIAMLELLWARRGAVVSRTEFLNEVWGIDAHPTTRTVDTHVGRLRKKLEDDPARPRHLLSIPRAGYRLEV